MSSRLPGSARLAAAGMLLAGTVCTASEATPTRADDPGSHHGETAAAVRVSWSAPDEVRMPLQFANGLPEVRGAINGHDVRMLVDTGSQPMVIDASTARRCGVKSLAPADEALTMRGIQGLEQARGGLPESVSLGAWTWRRLPCLIRMQRSKVPGILFGGMHPDLLGIEPLRRMCSFATFDARKQQITFGFGKAFQPEIGETAVPLEFRSGLPYVTISIGGIECAALLDTGASAELELNRETARKLGLTPHPSPGRVLRTGVGSGDPAAQSLAQADVPPLTFAGVKISNLEATVVPDDSKIGNGLLKKLRFTLDFERSRLWLSP